jgi:hypothetical protein
MPDALSLPIPSWKTTACKEQEYYMPLALTLEVRLGTSGFS